MLGDAAAHAGGRCAVHGPGGSTHHDGRSQYFGFFPDGVTASADIEAIPVGADTVRASLTEPEVPWSYWLIVQQLVGPFGPAGQPATTVNTSVVATLKPFDKAVSADSGDFWSDVTFGTYTYNPLVLAPAQLGVIHVTITPNAAQVGQVVRGSIYIDNFNGYTGDEIVRIPYAYTVAP
jgi:hypothetical protein